MGGGVEGKIRRHVTWEDMEAMNIHVVVWPPYTASANGDAYILLCTQSLFLPVRF